MQGFHKDCGGVGGELCLDPQREKDGSVREATERE